jgi:hypothetical protein
MNTFWMVWNEGNRQPTFKHKTEESARKEAERLARNCPGEVFHVLKVIATCQKVDVQWTEIEDDFIPDVRI